MPKYKVLRPIEHNQSLYLPAGSAAPPRTSSASHGQEIPVDAAGTIELDDDQARALVHGQIAPAPEAPRAGADRKPTRR